MLRWMRRPSFFGSATIRAEGFKVIPVCPYVLAQYKRHPEWADVMASRGWLAGVVRPLRG